MNIEKQKITLEIEKLEDLKEEDFIALVSTPDNYCLKGTRRALRLLGGRL